MSTNELIIIVVVYLVVSAFVAYVADNRGHGFETPFFVCVFTTPLIGAVLFAPYAQNVPGKKAATPPPAIKDVPETNWTPAQIELKKSYERGELTVEEYQKRWNETLKS